ncbi:MAG: TSUP family transporter [Phycisphaerae bacterium]
MALSTFVTLGTVALLTSVISAILGMGGGMLLLATMLCFLSHAEAIPTHAAVQIASNGTRALAFVKHTDRGALGRFLIGALPGAAAGAYLLWALGEPDRSEPYLKTLIGLYILAVTFVPRGRGGGADGTWWDFPLMGLAAGTAALTVGAVGPLIAPLFARRGFVKERLIATKAVCQLSLHILKIPAFVFLRDLNVARLGTLALVMIVMVIPGTLIGKRLLRGVSDRHFGLGYRIALTVAGTKVLIVDGLRHLVVF